MALINFTYNKRQFIQSIKEHYNVDENTRFNYVGNRMHFSINNIDNVEDVFIKEGDKFVFIVTKFHNDDCGITFMSIFKETKKDFENYSEEILAKFGEN